MTPVCLLCNATLVRDWSDPESQAKVIHEESCPLIKPRPAAQLGVTGEAVVIVACIAAIILAAITGHFFDIQRGYLP